MMINNENKLSRNGKAESWGELKMIGWFVKYQTLLNTQREKFFIDVMK